MPVEIGMLRAEWIGRRFENEPAFAMPERPRLNPSLLLVPFDGGLLVEGTPETQVLRGGFVRSMTAQLFPLLDGTRDLEAIAAAVPWPKQRLSDVLYLLYSRGLLEAGRGTAAPVRDDDLAIFAGRFLDATRANASREDVLERLAAARVVVHGANALAATIARELGACEIGTVDVVDALDEAARDATIAIVCADGPRALAFATRAFAARIPVLPVALGAREAQIGALLIRGTSPCPACLRRQVPTLEGEPEPTFRDLVASLAALSAFHVVSRLSNPSIFGSVQCHTLRDGVPRTNNTLVAPVPGCRACGFDGALDVDAPAFRAWRLHCATAMLPSGFETPKSYQEHYKYKNVKLTQVGEDPSLGGDVVALPSFGEAAGARGSRLQLAEIASLLRVAAGSQIGADGETHRIAATGGNLGSPHVRLIVNDVDGIAAGTYSYDGAHDRLVLLGPVPDASAFARALGAAAVPAALVIGAGHLQKLRFKYGDFGYRIVNLDGGVALAYLMRLASALGLDARECPVADDADLLALGRIASRLQQNVATFAVALEPAARAASEQPTLPDILGEVVDASRRVAPRAGRSRSDDASSVIGIAHPDDFVRLAVRRRSARSFGDAGLSLAQAAHVLRAAIAFGDDRILRGSAPHHAEPYLLVATPSGDLAAGVYRYVSGSFARVAPLAIDAFTACISQTNLRRAGALLIVVGDLDRALRLRGARGYRELLGMAGTIAAGATLAAEQLDVASCYSGGFNVDGLQAAIGIDGFKGCPLLAVALGERGGVSSPR